VKTLKPVRRRDLIDTLAETLISHGVTVDEGVEAFHRAMLEAALAQNNDNQVQTARVQGMHRNTLRNQMIALGMKQRRPNGVVNQRAKNSAGDVETQDSGF
jgi:DNA-binding NtrC family response regulator